MEAIFVGALKIPYSELSFSYSRSGGPGGQNVNKVESCVTLRFPFLMSSSIPYEIKRRAIPALESKLTQDGDILIRCDKSRSQWQNRAECLRRLAELLARAFRPPKIRRSTKPTRSSRTKRLESKRKHGAKKRERRVHEE